MRQQIDPKSYGLPPRTILIKQDTDTFILVINRKSRIIMKDARTILKKADLLKTKSPNAVILLETTAPVCSKSIQLLSENGINILKERQ